MSDLTREQGVQAEQAILATVLQQEGAGWQDVMAGIEPDDWYDAKHRAIAEAMLDVHTEGDPITLLTVQQALAAHRSDVTSLDVARLLADFVPVSTLPSQIRLVQAAADQRRIEALYSELGQALQQEDDPADIVEGQVQRLLALSNRIRRASRVEYSAAEVVPQVLDGYEQMAALHAQGVRYGGLDCGFPDLNDMLNGLCPEEETVLAARPSIGKTALGLQIAYYVARNTGKHVGWWSAEMSRRQVVGRIVQMASGIDAERFRKGNLESDELAGLRQAAEWVRELPLTIYETPGLTTAQFVSQAERLRSRCDVGLMVIDHLHRMSGGGNSLYEKFTRISSELRDYSLPTGTPHLLVLAQLNRQSEARTDKAPQLSELRDAGGIEQDAVNVMLLSRPGHYAEVRRLAIGKGVELSKLIAAAELIVAKTRFGPTGEINLHWDASTASFASAAPSYLTEAA